MKTGRNGEAFPLYWTLSFQRKYLTDVFQFTTQMLQLVILVIFAQLNAIKYAWFTTELKEWLHFFKPSDSQNHHVTQIAIEREQIIQSNSQ